MTKFLVFTEDNIEISKVKDLAPSYFIGLPEGKEDSIENYLVGETFPYFKFINLENGLVINTAECLKKFKEFQICFRSTSNVIFDSKNQRPDIDFLTYWAMFVEHKKGTFSLNEFLDTHSLLRDKD
ncbi:MAG TPA: hypothetical protein VI815_02630 [Candidatus Nanoarchaeia archaeon]|nr:hypothetical protein [Candidatus Nanoarchaeia archaeon]